MEKYIFAFFPSFCLDEQVEGKQRALSLLLELVFRITSETCTKINEDTKWKQRSKQGVNDGILSSILIRGAKTNFTFPPPDEDEEEEAPVSFSFAWINEIIQRQERRARQQRQFLLLLPRSYVWAQ